MGIERGILMVRRKGIGSRAITILLLLAFALQSYLTQTHVHENPTPAQACAVKCLVHIPVKHPGTGDVTADCPLCQAVVHAGTFFMPVALTFFVPRMWIEGRLVSESYLPSRDVFARNGLSRAPPR